MQDWTVIGCKLKQNANESCNSCASLAGLVLCFIACFILLVIAPLGFHLIARKLLLVSRSADGRRLNWPEHTAYVINLLKVLANDLNEM